jgi:DNA-directed RNA polymerase
MGYQITDDIMEPLQTQVNYGTLPGLILGEIQSNHPFGDYKSQGHHARFLANINYKAIKKTLSSVAMGMKFLQSYADALAREGKSCRWTSPSGFPVVMRYTKSTAKRVKIFLYDREAKMRNQTRINLKVDTDVADTRKSRSAVAANYVHSLDAAHMNLSILAGLDNHISDYFMIHDSFATTCHDTWKFWHCIRQTMVEIYEDNCVLGNFESECRQRLSNPDQDLEPVPEKGELIVADLVKSDYCFS